MPRLEDLAGRTRRPRAKPQPQSWEQQRDIARMVTVMFGGTVTERKQA